MSVQPERQTAMRLRVNPFLANGLLITLAICFSTALFLAQIRNETLQLAKTEQEQAIGTFWQLLRAKGGDFRIVDGRLMAGSYVLNGNYELPDTVRDIFGGTATVFMGDTRVSTNVLTADGRRAVGTKLTGPAYDAVFRENRPYRGEAPVLGITYFTAYDPITDGNGRTIGALYVGVKKEEFLAPYERLKQNMIVGAAAFELLFVALAFVVLSERNRREEALRETNLRLEAILLASPIPITALDRDMTVTMWNHAAESLFGWTAAEIVGQPYPLVPPDSREEFLKLRETVMTGRTIANRETLRQKKDGTLVALRISVAPLFGKGRGINGFMAILVDVTSIKRLETTLQEQLGFLQTLIDTIPSPIFYKDRGGRYLGCNRAFESYLGLTREQLVGKTVYDIAPKDLADGYFAMDEALFVNPGVQVYESSALYADGMRHDVIFNKAAFTGGDGLVAGLVGVILDVTERKKAENVLAEREEFLSDILDSIQDGISILDTELRIVRVNSFMDSYFSHKKPFAGRKCHEVYHERPQPCESCPSLATIRSGKPSSKIYTRHDNGTTVWMELRTFPLFDREKSRVTGVIEYVRNVTERKRAEAALRESEERFHQVFAQNGDAIVLFRLDGYAIIDANRAAEELTGYSREELLEFTPASFIDPADFAGLMTAMPAGDSSKAYQLDIAVGTRKDGRAMCIAIRVKVLRLRDEHVVHCSIRDITDKVRLEDEIRTTQAKLIHANKMTSLGMLASSISHEINNPNNYISVNAAMLADAWRDALPILDRRRAEQGDFLLGGLPCSEMLEAAPRLFTGIMEGSRRINAIIANMKDYVKTNKGGPSAEFELNGAVRDATSILWHHIHRYTDNFTLNAADGLPPARGNRQQIEQVVINLIMNALQSLPDKRRGVAAETAFDRETGFLTVTIRDEGEGMERAVLEHLTKPFFTTKIDEGGTGLGLYISASIVKEHNGSLEFDSLPGRGTTVTVRLPAA
ncbi:MAG TPA: PAS domain S-box protein [Geobacteraceae bacterium]